MKRLRRMKPMKSVINSLLIIALLTSMAAPAMSAKKTDTDSEFDLQLRELRNQLLPYTTADGGESADGTEPGMERHSIRLAELISSNETGVVPSTYSPDPQLPDDASVPPVSPIDMAAAAVSGDDIQRISMPVPGLSESGGGRMPSISGDGRYIAFRGREGKDILFYDSVTKATRRITTGYDDKPANGASYRPLVSMEGRYVLFASKATNLVPNDTGFSGTDLYLYNQSSGTLSRIGRGVAASDDNTPYAISASGRYVAFTAGDPPPGVPDDGRSSQDLYRIDLVTEEAIRIVSDQYRALNISTDVSISADGNVLAFTTEREDPMDSQGTGSDGDRLFVYDVPSGQFELIGRTLDGDTGNIGAYAPALSPDGRYVAFGSKDDRLVPGDSGSTADLFLYDRRTDETRLVGPLVSAYGNEYSKGNVSISAGGQYAAYKLTDNSSYTTVTDQVYMTEMTGGQTDPVSTNPQGAPGGHHSDYPSLSHDGSTIAFQSLARDLIQPPEPGIDLDVFRKSLHSADPPGPAPIWPSEAAVSVVQQGSVYAFLEWPEAEGGQGQIFYKIYQDGQLVDIVRSNRYLARGLVPGESVSFQVIAGSESFVWNEGLPAVEVTTDALPETTPPGIASGIEVEPDYGILRVSWADPADADLAGIRVLWRKTGTAAFREQRVRPGIGEAVLHVINGTNYELKIITVDVEGNEASTPLIHAVSFDGPVIEKLSEAEDGSSGNDNSENVSINRDGRYMVYETGATNLVSGQSSDGVVLYDRVTGTNRFVDVKADGSATGSGATARMSASGRYIVYQSDHRGLAGIEGKRSGFVLHDRDADGNGVFDEPGGTSNRHLGFPPNELLNYDQAAVEGDEAVVSVTGWWRDTISGEERRTVYLYDFSSGTWKQPETENGLVPNGNTYGASISGNGEWLAFYTEAYNLDPNDPAGLDLYMYHIPTKQFKLAELPVHAGSFAGLTSIDETGRFVVTALRPSSQPLFQIYLYDREANAGELVSQSAAGEPGNGRSDMPAISGDGRYVAFVSRSANLVDSVSDRSRLFIWDRATKSIQAPLTSFDNAEPDAEPEYPVLNGDGTVVAFASYAGNLVRGDRNDHVKDVFWMPFGEAPPAVPLWPPGSKLEAVAIGQEEVTLRWTPVQGAVRYRIAYGDGQQLFIDDGAAERTVAGLAPGTAYLFQVQAAGPDGRWTSDGPSLSVNTMNAEEPVVTIGQFRVTVPYKYKNTIAPGASLGMVITGTPGGTAAATITYMTADGNNAAIAIPLSEKEGEAGRYEGVWQLPAGIGQITAAKGSITVGLATAEKISTLPPVNVGGVLNVIAADTPYWDQVSGATVTVYSPSLGLSDAKPLLKEGTLFIGLPEADDYVIGLRSKEWYPLLEGAGPSASIQAGEERQITLIPRVPASLALRAAGEDGAAIPFAQFTVKRTDGRYVMIGTALSDGSLPKSVAGLYAGDEVIVTVSDREHMHESADRTIALQPGENDETVKLKAIVPVTVSGTVTDPDGVPIPGAIVSVSQRFKGTTHARTADNGQYSLLTYSGTATINASLPGASSAPPAEVHLKDGEENRHDLVLNTPPGAIVNINLYTKHIGGEWVGPVELDWRTFVHYHVQVVSHSYSGNTNPMFVKAVPGETVTICAAGYEARLSKMCGTAVVDANKRAAVELRLEETGGIVKGMLSGSEHTDLNLYRLLENGTRRWVRGIYLGRGGEWSVNVPETGTYQLEFSTYDIPRFAQKTVEVRTGEQIDVGTVTLSDPGMFEGQPGNEVSLRQKELSNDTPLDVVARYRNGGSRTADEAELVLDIPAGTRLDEEAGIFLNGSKAAYRQENSNVVIPIGTVSNNVTGIVTYRLKAGDLQEGEQVSVTPRMRFKVQGRDNVEAIGTDAAVFARLTMEAAEVTGRADFAVSGRAPTGSKIRVYDDELLLGETEAFTDGSWRLPVRLQTGETESVHRLWSEALRGTERWTTSGVQVRYDSKHVEIEQMSMQQSDGRKVTFDPGEGVAKFPYVWAPGYPFHFELKFNRPELVEDVSVTVGGTSAEAYLAPNGVTHVAVLNPLGTGPVYVHYETAKMPVDFLKVKPSMDMIGKDMPQAWRNAPLETVHVTPETSPSVERTAAFKGSLPGGENPLDFNGSVTVQPAPGYTPSEADLEKAARTGVPVYGLQLTPTKGNGELTIAVSGYFEKDMLDRMGTEGALQAMLGGTAGTEERDVKPKVELFAVKDFIKVSYRFVVKNMDELLEPAENLWEKFERIHALLEGYGLKDIFEELGKLEELLRYVEDHCSPENAQQFMIQIDRLFMDVVILEITKAMLDLTVAGVAYLTGAVTFGLSILAFIAIDVGLDYAFEAVLDTEIEEVKNEVDRVCRKGKKKADPVWIHDPSGYVYEVEPSNRVEGVQATVLQKNESDGSWNIWDASWFEQVNPQMTDAEGRYGWFVPDGLWKVHYEKEGYLPAESAELRVLPPHFDVNVPIVSMLPSKVSHIRPAPGGKHVDIWFDRHVLMETANEYTVSVRASEEEQAGGRVEAVSPVEWNGKTVARQIRFIPDADLEIGRSYELIVTSGIQSYNGIPAGEDDLREFTVTAKDETAPSPVKKEDVSIYAAEDHIMLLWKDPTDPDFKQAEVSWSSAGGEGGPVIVQKGVGWAKLEGLQPHSSYTLVIRSMDEDGNGSDLHLTAETPVQSGVEPDVAPPAAVTDLSAEPGTRSLKATWSDSTSADAEFVTLRWMKTGEQEELGSAKVETGVQSYTIEGLSPDTDYTITASVTDREDNESFAVGVETRTKADRGGGSGGGEGGGDYVPPIQPEAADEWTVGPEGGEWSAFDGKLRIRVPMGAVDRSSVWKVRKIDPSETIIEPDYKIYSAIYELSVDPAVSLLKTVQISVALEPLSGEDPRKLTLYQRKGESADWTMAGGWADETGMEMETFVSGPGIYSVMARNRSFADMEGHWARMEAEVLYSRGIVNGVTVDQFQPNRPITRAELVKLLVGWKGADDSAQTGEPLEFTDVAPESWYYEAVGTASRLGWVKGHMGKFRPDDPVTREEIAVIFYRVLGAADSSFDERITPFPDNNDVSDWARAGVAFAVKHSWLRGMEDGRLEPGSTATRAQAAAVLLRAMETFKQ